MENFSYIRIDPGSLSADGKTFKLPDGMKVIPSSLVSGGPPNDPKCCEWKLDRLALTACQAYNIGNADNWFFPFRMAMAGVAERLAGQRIHSVHLHEWTGQSAPLFYDHDVLVILFCMDSAIECFAFMLNALGQAFNKIEFRDISSEKGIRGIGPRDVMGKSPQPGYSRFFPTLQAHWQENAELLEMIMANHDVAKHRHSPPFNAMCRQDPPDGYFEAIGLAGDSTETLIARGRRTPLQQVLLSKNPRLPAGNQAGDLRVTLEELEQAFKHFLPKSFCLALEDARSTLPLRDTTLHL